MAIRMKRGNTMYTKIIFLLGLIFSVFYSEISFCGTHLNSSNNEDHIACAKNINYIGRVRGPVRNNNFNFADSTCVLIDRYWVLTAAHAVYYSDNLEFIYNNKKYQIDKIIYNKIYDINNHLSEWDIAICRLSEPVDIDKYPELYEETEELGKTCIIAGFGLFGSAYSDVRIKDNIKRAGTNKIFDIQQDKLVCDININNATKLEYMVAMGDSGGPLIIDNKIAGIHSYTDGTGKSMVGDLSFHTRVSRYVDWIKTNIKNNTKSNEDVLVSTPKKIENQRTWWVWFGSWFYSEKENSDKVQIQPYSSKKAVLKKKNFKTKTEYENEQKLKKQEENKSDSKDHNAVLKDGGVLIFITQSCPACQIFKSTVQNIRFNTKSYAIVDSDKEQDLTEKFKIESFPTFIMVKKNEEVSRLEGYSAPELQSWLDNY